MHEPCSSLDLIEISTIVFSMTGRLSGLNPNRGCLQSLGGIRLSVLSIAWPNRDKQLVIVFDLPLPES